MISSHDTVPWCIEVGEGEGGDTVKRIADNNGLKNHNKGACQPRGRRSHGEDATDGGQGLTLLKRFRIKIKIRQN